MRASVFVHIVCWEISVLAVFFFNKSHILRSDYIHVKTTDILYNLLEMTCLYIGLCKAFEYMYAGITNFQQFNL